MSQSRVRRPTVRRGSRTPVFPLPSGGRDVLHELRPMGHQAAPVPRGGCEARLWDAAGAPVAQTGLPDRNE